MLVFPLPALGHIISDHPVALFVVGLSASIVLVLRGNDAAEAFAMGMGAAAACETWLWVWNEAVGISDVGTWSALAAPVLPALAACGVVLALRLMPVNGEYDWRRWSLGLLAGGAFSLDSPARFDPGAIAISGSMAWPMAVWSWIWLGAGLAVLLKIVTRALALAARVSSRHKRER
jgi:hypothetical protein